MIGALHASAGSPYGHKGCTWGFNGASGQGSSVCYKLRANGKEANVLVFDGCAGYKGSKPCCYEGGPTDCSEESTCDWCAANDHPHFDLDTTTFGYLSQGTGKGHFVVEHATPFICEQ